MPELLRSSVDLDANVQILLQIFRAFFGYLEHFMISTNVTGFFS